MPGSYELIGHIARPLVGHGGISSYKMKTCNYFCQTIDCVFSYVKSFHLVQTPFLFKLWGTEFQKHV